jgi:putative salt-induced outer membrane protein YdiY
MKIKIANLSARTLVSTSALYCGAYVALLGGPPARGETLTNAVPKWDVSVAAGVTVTKGNSDTELFTLTGRADKKWDANEIHLGLDAAYGEDQGEKNNESVRAVGQYNRLFTDRWYVYARAEGLHDAIADVEYRFTVGPGVGYYFIKSTNTTLNVDGGPAVVFEKEGPNERSYFTVRVGEKLEHKFNDRVRIWEAVEFLPQVDHFENYIINGEAGVESALSKSWALRFVLQDTYDNRPAPGRKENDLKLVAALAWKLIH